MTEPHPEMIAAPAISFHEDVTPDDRAERALYALIDHAKGSAQDAGDPCTTQDAAGAALGHVVRCSLVEIPVRLHYVGDPFPTDSVAYFVMFERSLAVRVERSGTIREIEFLPAPVGPFLVERMVISGSFQVDVHETGPATLAIPAPPPEVIRDAARQRLAQRGEPPVAVEDPAPEAPPDPVPVIPPAVAILSSMNLPRVAGALVVFGMLVGALITALILTNLNR